MTGPIDYDELRRYAVRPSRPRRGVPPRVRTTWLEKLLDRAYLAIRRFRTRTGR